MPLNPFSGYVNGVPYPAGGSTVTEAFDTNSGCEWFNSGHGFKPGSAAFDVNNQLTIAAELTTHVVTVPVTGLYRVSALVVSTNATSGTIPAVTVTYTDADSAVAQTVDLLTDTSSSASGTSKSADAVVNVKAGGTITFTGTSYASLQYSAKLRTEYIG
jgi:hypothetical protein